MCFTNIFVRRFEQSIITWRHKGNESIPYYEEEEEQIDNRHYHCTTSKNSRHNDKDKNECEEDEDDNLEDDVGVEKAGLRAIELRESSEKRRQQKLLICRLGS